jgi:hypothetical protein
VKQRRRFPHKFRPRRLLRPRRRASSEGCWMCLNETGLPGGQHAHGPACCSLTQCSHSPLRLRQFVPSDLKCAAT